MVGFDLSKKAQDDSVHEDDPVRRTREMVGGVEGTPASLPIPSPVTDEVQIGLIDKRVESTRQWYTRDPIGDYDGRAGPRYSHWRFSEVVGRVAITARLAHCTRREV
jgi:hypothetical protein